MSESVIINSVSCQANKIDNNFYKANYNGIDLILSHDRTKFHANKLLEQLCSRKKSNGQPSKSVNDWLKHKTAETLKRIHPGWFVQLKFGKTKPSWFFDLHCLHSFATSCDSIKGELWLMNENWQDEIIDNGFIYLVKSSIHKDTNIYKIGRTWNLAQRFKQYGKDIVIYKTQAVSNQYQAEEILIKKFESKYEHATKEQGTEGEEYFYCENVDEAINTFKEVIDELYEMDLIEE